MKPYFNPGEEWRNLAHQWKLILEMIKRKIDDFDQDKFNILGTQVCDCPKTPLWQDFADFDMYAARVRYLNEETLKLIHKAVSKKFGTNC
jgi:hypothetical protein